MKAPEIPGYKYLGTSVNRFVAKTEITNSRKGLTTFLKNLLGEERFNQLTEVDINKYLKDLEQANNIRSEVMQFVKPLYEKLINENTKNSNKKANELISIGRFFQSLNKLKDIKIIEEGEPPDFIIEYKDALVGIEITGIYNSEVVAEINTAKEILKKCQIKLSEETNLKDNIQLNIFPSKLKFSKSQEGIIVADICDYVTAKENRVEFTAPDYIKYMFKEESENLDLVLYEDYWLTQLTAESVNKTILGKEKDIVKYKDEKKLKKCWLLIVIGGASSISSFDYSLISNFDSNTKFDNVFIYETFNGKIIYSKHSI
jgi:hypothetical protein